MAMSRSGMLCMKIKEKGTFQYFMTPALQHQAYKVRSCVMKAPPINMMTEL